MNKRKYVPNLATMHKVCDHNYARLLRLLPDCDTQDLNYRFAMSDQLAYQIKIIETSPYTTLLSIGQLSDALPLFLSPSMKVRLYHDAKMAEVISAENLGTIQPSYPYPNQQMHQPNEKEMINLFLAEWLQFCVQQPTRCPT